MPLDNQHSRLKSDDEDEDEDEIDSQSNRFEGISNEYHDHGDPIFGYESCGELLWHAESSVGNTHANSESYSLCCGKGKVMFLTALKNPPKLLMDLIYRNHSKSTNFIDNIRWYNSMFAFTFMGGKQDKSVNSGRGPYCYRVQGMNCHRMGALLPGEGKPPLFGWLVSILWQKKQNNVRLRLIGTRECDGRQYDLPTASEVAALIVRDFDSTEHKKDIILERQGGDLKRISELHPSYLALQYPLLFSYTKDGYRTDIYHRRVTDLTPTYKKTRVSMREWFAYRLQDRPKGEKDLRSETYSKLAKLAADPDSGVTIRDLFITFTCNPNWPEIACFVAENGLKSDERPDMITRVFKQKLDSLMKDFKEKHCCLHYRVPKTRSSTCSHITFLEPKDKLATAAHIDKYISAEIPDKDEDLELYQIVTDHMMHGPCGAERPSCPCSIGSIKYLFKYINKGPDRVTVAVEKEEVDEIDYYYNCRYLSACEAAWRIYSFDIHYMFPPVERLPFHLPNEQSVIFDETESLDYTLENVSVNETKFQAWMERNKTDTFAQMLLYVEFPKYYVWKHDEKVWLPRQKGESIRRINHVPPSWGEIFYLRVFLNKVRGAMDWEDFKEFEGVHYLTFKDDCYARGLLEDDNEYIDGLIEASHWGMGNYLRRFFVMLIMTDSMSRPEFVYEKTWHFMASHVEKLVLSDEEKKNICLLYIEHMLLSNNKSLKSIPNMPYPTEEDTRDGYNRLVHDELSYNKDKLKEEHKKLYGTLTDEQKGIYETIMGSIDKNRGGMFFVYGYGGTGKTYLYKTMSAACRSQGGIVLNVASSGIVALLLEGGRTTHSSELAELLRMTKLIIWDEAPMVNRHCYEAFDRTMRDICGTDALTPSEQLTVIMRLGSGSNTSKRKEIQDFADWILNIRNGKIDGKNDGKANVKFSDDMSIPDSDDHIGDEKTYNSSNTTGVADVDTNFNETMYTKESLNNLNMAGIPHHSLKLMIGTPVMCAGNIDQKAGLCNRTRLQVLRMGTNVIEAKIISGGSVGTIYEIPRMVISPSDNKLSFKLNRRQFPIEICFGVTINKSQG
ncbi:hypothetical protein Tco_0218153 [Tanacetum coccineum]